MIKGSNFKLLWFKKIAFAYNSNDRQQKVYITCCVKAIMLSSQKIVHLTGHS